MMTRPRVTAATRTALALLTLAGCAERGPLSTTEPTAPVAPPATAEGVAAITCRGSVRTVSFSCRADTGAGSSADAEVRYSVATADGEDGAVIIGGQGVFVMLAANAIAKDGTTFGFDVTVQNLIPQPLGTADGSSPADGGVRVFFTQEPVVTGGAGSIAVKAGTPEGTFTASEQPYYQYDGVLATNATSASRRWEFTYSGDVEFEFQVAVWSPVPFPRGWIDITAPSSFLADDASQQLLATVRRWNGTLAEDQSVSWTTDAPGTATVDGTGLVSGVAAGTAAITATQGVRTGARSIDVCPSLDVGEVHTATFPAAARLCLAGDGSGNADYTYMPINLSDVSSLSLSVTGSGIIPVSGTPNPGMSVFEVMESPPIDEAMHRRTLEANRQVRGALVANGRGSGAGAARGARSVPVVGDLLYLYGAGECNSGSDLRTARVQSVGQNVIVVADTLNPLGGFTAAQYDSIAMEFDTLAWHVLTSNFGTPTDIDGNGRVILFFTRTVNELSPTGTAAWVPAVFKARDLYTAASCPLSNEGEIIYLVTPDPTGVVNGNIRTLASVRGQTTVWSLHESLHLVNASTRLYVTGGDLEEAWLDEQLAGIAEELAFYHTSAGLAPGQDLTVIAITGGALGTRRTAAFNAFAFPNFTRLRAWLQRPDTTGAFKGGTSLAAQGAGWAFLRYTADRRGGDQTAFWQSLVNTNLTGKANLEAASGASVDDWWRDFVVAMYADNAVTGTSSVYTQPSWNFRDLFNTLNGVYQVQPRPLSNGVTLTLSYSRGGGSTYARLGVPAGGFATITALSGGTVPVTPFALAVVRTK